ncbi:PAS domain-containing protein [Rufibacter sp. H-1]|uniref:PAS domain-containing protein n=1 Tax=Rufibacter sediminis TaxID=2762756 RepID=A0ABR6VQ11_9BACT|nr:PAS domain-containing protein [Rufibacter sediminis]
MSTDAMHDHHDSDLLKTLAAQTGKVLFSYDLDSCRLTFLNPAFSHIWGRTRESALTDPATVWEAVHPDDRDYLAKEYRELTAGIIRQEIEFRIVLPDKSVRWLSVSPHGHRGAGERDHNRYRGPHHRPEGERRQHAEVRRQEGLRAGDPLPRPGRSVE